jgi:glucosamine--fructose-6-phosphate aminotransferase (isomerizing)
MEAMKPEVLLAQLEDLPRLTHEQIEPFDHEVQRALATLPVTSLQRAFITGNGDSYYAALACELAFEQLGGMPNEPPSAQRFLDYALDLEPAGELPTALVIGVSASGGTEHVARSLTRARERGMATLAVTGAPDSRVAQAAAHTIPVSIPDMGRSPGIRTYQASLLGLLLLAIRLGEQRGRLTPGEGEALRQELSALRNLLVAVVAACQQPARQAARAFRDEPFLLFLGAGPGYGTARFAAAKVVEASGLFAAGQELEEWWHVERFAYPEQMGIVLIAPPGRSHEAAVELAASARALGRRLLAVMQEGDEAIGRHAEIVFPVPGDVREPFSPLVYHCFASAFASYLAQELGRLPFQGDRPAFQAAVDGYYAGRGSR